MDFWLWEPVGWGAAPSPLGCSNVNCISISSNLFVVIEEHVPLGSCLCIQCSLGSPWLPGQGVEGRGRKTWWPYPHMVRSPGCPSLSLKAGRALSSLGRRKEVQGAAGCLHWLLGGKESKPALILFFPWHLSAICGRPNSFDLSLTFHKASLSCWKESVRLNWSFSCSSPKTNTLNPHVWFSENSKQNLEHFTSFQVSLHEYTFCLSLHSKHIQEKKCQAMKLCSVSKYDNFLLRHNCSSFCPLFYSDPFSCSGFTFSCFPQIIFCLMQDLTPLTLTFLRENGRKNVGRRNRNANKAISK